MSDTDLEVQFTNIEDTKGRHLIELSMSRELRLKLDRIAQDNGQPIGDCIASLIRDGIAEIRGVRHEI